MNHPTPESDPDSPELNSEEAIQRGLRISLALLVLLVVGGGVTYFLLNPKKGPAPVKMTQLAAPKSAGGTQVATPPASRFTRVTSEAGIRFRHENGATGEKLLPETMGGGVAFLDIDADQRPDLIFVNSSRWPWKGAGDPPPGVVLYRNESVPGRLAFRDATAGSGLETPFYGMGIAAGDYDNDGLPDLLITGVGGARLYHNEGAGKFRDVTDGAGVRGDAADWSTASAWFDLDNDGDLDLFVGNYVRWSREIDAEVGYKLTGGARAYGPPMNFQGAFPRLYRNDGNGKFTDVSATAGVQVRNPATQVPAAKTLGVAPIDLNGDRWMDLVVANDTVQNFVFLNQKNGTFKEVGALTGVAFDSYGNTRGAMGVDAARFTPEGRIAISIGNFANEMTAFYVAQKDPLLFTDEAISWGIGGPSRDPLKFGIFFFDYDLDGRLDLLSVNGHLEEEISKIQHGQRYEQAPQLFWNNGSTGFTPVSTNAAGTDLYQPIVGRGSAFADMDQDGDLDVVMTALHGEPVLLRNDAPAGHHWLRVRVRGSASNRDGIGTWIQLTAAGRTRWQQIMPTRSYLSQSEAVATFGLGDGAQWDSLVVEWPSGRTTTVTPTGPRSLRLNLAGDGVTASEATLDSPVIDTVLALDEPR